MILLFVPAAEVSYFDLLMKGGWLMVPLFLLSIISVYIFFDRYIYLKSQKRTDSAFFEMLKNLVKEGKIDTALALCASTDSSESRILTKGIQNLGKPLRDIHELMEMEGKLEVYKYEGNMYFLGVIAGVAPMMGFIGTIAGVIKIFYSISLADNISISLISGGLYEKLITSGVGLSIGIIAYVSYHFLNHKINRLVQSWELQCVRFIDLINNSSK
ncbi:MAG: MotA/TolQ/ExbB proton channel family protein [Bacteroidia bacterium]|nr:MotA/TolQ/ExbB proton channel family protein [Bacteroidia bacterium]